VIGKHLAQFDVTEKLGEGGMGAVYRARDTKLGRDVAIKVLPEAFVADPERLLRFEREAKVLAALDHPNIAGIFEVGHADGVHFLAMQLAPGEDLSARIGHGAMPVDEALPIALQVAGALEVAHAQGIVHRDLKPANVKVESGGSSGLRVKVLDFGLAKAWSEETESDGRLSMSPTLTAQMTQTGIILGTAGYMSPEQARGQRVDARSDVWSFGVMLWEMLTGRQLFREPTVSDTLAAVLKTQIDLASLPADLPPSIRRLIARCLERDPRQRLQAIGEARITIERYLANPEAERASVEPTGATVQSPGRLARWAPIAVATLIAGLLGALAMRQLDGPAPTRAVSRFEIRLSENSGRQFSRPVLSPDGRSIAYGTDHLWVRFLEQLESRPIPGTDGARLPIWSPDSRHVAFQGEDRRLYRTDLVRGGTRLIAELPGNPFLLAANWLGDGAVLAAAWHGDVYRVPASGGRPEVFFDLDETKDLDVHGIAPLPEGLGILLGVHELSDGWALVAVRDGERIQVAEGLLPRVFVDEGILIFTNGEQPGLWARPFDPKKLEFRGEPTLVASDARVPSVAADGSLAYGVDTGPSVLQVAQVDRHGAIVNTFGEPLANLQGPRLSPDGTQIVAEYRGPGESSNNIGVYHLARSVWTRLTSEDKDQSHPCWSGDSRRIYFRDGSDLATIRSDGVGGKTILFPGRDPEASGDGAWLIFIRDATMLRVALGSDGLPDGDPEPVSGTPAGSTMRGPLSPDGRYILYGSDSNGTVEIYMTEFPDSSSRWQISKAGGVSPAWRSDGGAIYYSFRNVVYEVSADLSESGIHLGSPVALFGGTAFNGSTGNGVSPMENGEAFLVVSDPSESAAEPPKLVLVQNWLAGLRED